jgi:hypothetical protein
MDRLGAASAVPLQRGLAQLLLAAGDRAAAIEAYRGILAVEEDGAADRIALAEIYATEDLHRGIAELKRVLQEDLRHAPAYRLLGTYLTQAGEPERAARVFTVMDLLGYAEESDRLGASSARVGEKMRLRQPLSAELRTQSVRTAAARSPLTEVLEVIADELAALVAKPALGENLVPVKSLADLELQTAVGEASRVFELEAEVYVGDGVPGGAVALAQPRRLVVIDRALLDEPAAAQRFLLGCYFEALRGGYAPLLCGSPRQRSELAVLVRSLLLPEAERSGPTSEFIATLPRRALKVLERHAGVHAELDPEAWVDGLLASARRAGLLLADDFTAAVRVLARLGGDTLDDDRSLVGLGSVIGGADLVRFYLSDEYHQLRETLAAPLAPT